MVILNEFDTIRSIIRNGFSIARYGDGELKICFGKSAKTQPASPRLTEALRMILKADQDKVLIGIPRMHLAMTDRKKSFWAKYMTKRFTNLYDANKIYGSAFVTRPDSAPEIDVAEYFDLVKQIWRGKKVLLYQGVGRNFLKAKPNLFETAESYEVVFGLPYDAFSRYDRIQMELVKRMKKFDLLVVSLGAAATVLAFDLGMMGIQTLDLGHLGMFYAKAHPKSTQYDGSPVPKDGPQ